MIFAIPAQCPWCGEHNDILVEHDVEGEMVVDCEVCCRPQRVVIHFDVDGVHADISRE